MRSNNSFAKANRNLAVGAFAGIGTPSVNVMARVPYDLSGNAFNGENLTSDAYGFDSPDGTPYGIDEYGGISHFLGVTQPVVTH